MNSAKVTLKTEKEHLHERKELYIGNCQTVPTEMWVIEGNKLVFKEIYFNEGYFKLINEILDNSVDEYVKTQGKFANKISFNFLPNGYFEIIDNGRGISSEKDENLGISQVELAFCNLKAGSNWGADKTTQIGANGIGASAVNLMSEYFKVETWDGKQKTELICKNECENVEVKHKRNKDKRGTKVTFKINSRHFNDLHLISEDLLFYMCFKRVIELFSSYPSIEFKFNGVAVIQKIWDFLSLEGKVFKFKDFEVGMFFKTQGMDECLDLSYVNGIDSYKGGTHVKYVKRKINELIRENIEKKSKTKITNSFINSHILYVVSIKNFMKPEFSTQNKTELINPEKDLNAFFTQKEVFSMISQKFYTSYSSEFKKLIESIKTQSVMKLANEVQKNSKSIKRITKFIDANDRNRKDTILFLVEGDSAKGHFEVVRDIKKQGMFPLRGKILNAFKHPLSKVLQNEEIINILSILKLKIGDKPDQIYFDKIGILSDADVDGDHISIMITLFFYKYFPDLFNQGKILKILSPIVIAKKGKKVKNFYSYEEYVSVQEKYKDWTIKYNKGLGGLKREEYADMLNDLKYDVLTIDDMKETERIMEICFGKNTEERQNWLQGKDILKSSNSVDD